MCYIERQVWYTWKCGHYAPDIPADRIDWCTDAEARGSHCDPPTATSKASSRGYAARNDCPDCRNNKTKPPPKDDDAGAGGAGSATTGQSTGIAVGA